MINFTGFIIGLIIGFVIVVMLIPLGWIIETIVYKSELSKILNLKYSKEIIKNLKELSDDEREKLNNVIKNKIDNNIEKDREYFNLKN